MQEFHTAKTDSKLRKTLIFIIKLTIFLVAQYFLVWKPDMLLLDTNISGAPAFGHKLVFNIVAGLSFFLFINLINTLLCSFVISVYVKRHDVQNIAKNNFVLGINRIGRMIDVVAIIIAIMLVININPLNFITSISIVAAAVALLSKDYITNMINGLIIMFSDKLSLGDVIVVGHQKGKIMDITFLNVALLDEENDIQFIPNTVMLNSVIINQSRLMSKKVSIDFKISNSTEIDYLQLENIIFDNLKPYFECIEANSLVLKPTHIDDLYVAYRLQLNILKSHKQDESGIKRIVNETIIKIQTHEKKKHII